MPTLRPNTDLVVQAWLASIPGLPGQQIGPQLPEDNSTWSASGFIQTTTVGGTPNAYYRLAKPVLQLDFWAVNPTSAKAPWGKANSLAEIVRAATYDPTSFEQVLALPGSYAPARLMSAYFLDEPRRVYGATQDLAAYARYTVNCQLVWTV